MGRIREKELSKQNFTLSRKVSKDEYLPMTNAIKDAHEEIKPYHFSNEADLINRIVLGQTASKYPPPISTIYPERRTYSRLSKSSKELDCIVSLQRANTVYIEDGLDFQERKDKAKFAIQSKA